MKYLKLLENNNSYIEITDEMKDSYKNISFNDKEIKTINDFVLSLNKGYRSHFTSISNFRISFILDDKPSLNYCFDKKRFHINKIKDDYFVLVLKNYNKHYLFYKCDQLS